MGKHKNKKLKNKKKKGHDTSSSSSEGEWVEKTLLSNTNASTIKSTTREEWMSLSTTFSSVSNTDKRNEREKLKRLEQETARYKPNTNVRELNPYWKNGGNGLPQFKKPSDDFYDDNKPTSTRRSHEANWRKNNSTQPIKNTVEQIQTSTNEILSDKDMNVLGAKIIKAELMGNHKLVEELKQKLENARKVKNLIKPEIEQVLLTETTSKGQSRPLRTHQNDSSKYGNQKKKRKMDTHADGERIRYYPDDDKRTLNQMFEDEKFNSADMSNNEFYKMMSKTKKNDDLDDVFSDNIRMQEFSDKRKTRAIRDHQNVSEALNTCRRCIQSEMMPKHLMISMGNAVYLSLPSHEPLTENHCLIAPIRHVPCATLLDENEWEELMDYRRTLTAMYAARDEDVIYFECAIRLEMQPHMVLECIPVPKEIGDLAPIYFKKAIDESEIEWTQNKKLIAMNGKDVRKVVPKGLPYFTVSFGNQEGYAHVIEDATLFPNNFAQEIIGGILDLDHSKWRKPKMESFDNQSKRVIEFNKNWCKFDFINKTD